MLSSANCYCVWKCVVLCQGWANPVQDQIQAGFSILRCLMMVEFITCCDGASFPRLVRRLNMLRSDICRRAETGGILESMLGSRVTSAFMSLKSSSSWFSTVRQEKTALMSIYEATFNEGVSCEIKTNAKDIKIINANVSDNSNLQENISIKTCFYLRWFKKVKNNSLFQMRHSIFPAASGLGVFPNIDDHMGRFSQWVKLQVKWGNDLPGNISHWCENMFTGFCFPCIYSMGGWANPLI